MREIGIGFEFGFSHFYKLSWPDPFRMSLPDKYGRIGISESGREVVFGVLFIKS